MTGMTRRDFLAATGLAGAGAVLAACSSSKSPSAVAGGGSSTASAGSSSAQPAGGSSAPAPVGGSSSATSTSDTLATARKQGSIRVAFETDKPLSYEDPTTGKLTGSGPAVLGYIMAKLGIPQLEPILVDFDALIPGLIANRWDISAFPFYITPARGKLAAFTNPVAQYLEGALVRTGNPKNLHSYTDLANPGVKVAIQSGNSEIDWAKSAGVKDSQVQLYEQEALAVQALKQGRADAYLNASFALVQDMKNYGATGVQLATPFKGPIVNGAEVVAYGGFALRIGDDTLRNAFNAQLATMLSSGELLTLESPYGYMQLDMPPANVTAASLCPDATWK